MKVLLFALLMSSPCLADDSVTAEMQNPENKAKLVVGICKGVDEKTCNAKVANVFVARLRERYPKADTQAISIRCDAHPVECADWPTLESWFSEAHDSVADAVPKKRPMWNILGWSEDGDSAPADDGRRKNRRGQPMPTQTRCKSRVSGNRIMTNCEEN